MHMGIDEAWHDVLCVAHSLLLNLSDFAVLNDDHARENPGIDKVDNLTSDGKAVVHEFKFGAKLRKCIRYFFIFAPK